MINKLQIKDKVIVADSRLIANGYGQEHRFTYRLILQHKEKLEKFGVLRFESVKPKTGRPMKIAYLNESQSLLLLTYTRSTKRTDELREQLIRDFTTMRRALLEASMNKSNQEWLTNRDEGKLQRRETTDIIKQFIDYSVKDGSKNASRYYGNISTMENKALFLVQEKFPNLRDVMNNRQLSFIKSADIIVEEAIRHGMAEGMFYKDIYQLCKKRVMSFADLIPRTAIPMMIEETTNKKELK